MPLMLKIDVHAHLYHPAYIDELDGLLERAASPAERGAARHNAMLRRNAAAVDVEQRVELMDRLGVGAQVLSLSIPMSYEGDAATRLRLARITNDHFAEAMALHPNRFFAFATLPLPDVDASLKEMRRCLDELHMVGVGFGSNIQGMRLDHAHLAPIFEEMDRRRTVAFLHPNTPVCAGPDLEEYNLASSLAYIFDTGVTVYRMIFSGMLERHRQMKVIVPHLGGMLPFNTGRIQGNYRREVAQNLPREPLAYMKELYYDTVSFHQPALRLVHEMFGAAHMMLGSDYPLGSGTLERSVNFVADSGLSEADQALVFGRNAVEVLRLRL
jgi:predicted TIM-barrel fold metal-dependent hydrolase